MATLRQTYIPGERLRFTNIIRHRIKFEDNSSEIAVSTVDFLMPGRDAFIQERTNSYGRIAGGNLNKGGAWEAVIEELEATCISKMERKDNRDRRLTQIIYCVPVVGYVQFTNKTDDDYMIGSYHGYKEENSFDGRSGLKKAMRMKIKSNPAKFMFWEGKYYSTDLMYAFYPERSNSLQVIGNLYAAMPTLHGSGTEIGEFTRSIIYRNQSHQRVRDLSRIIHEDKTQSQQAQQGKFNCAHGGWTQCGVEDYLEIDLGYPRFVTHIGTAGEYPALKAFPTRRTVGRKRMRRFRTEALEEDEGPILSKYGNGIHQRKFSSYVRVMKDCDERSLAYVRAYEVHYRHPDTRRWSLLVSEAAGNSHALTEAVLDLRPFAASREGLFTQYLRIRPIVHHLRPTMRISVYGVDPKKTVSATHAASCLNDSDSSLVTKKGINSADDGNEIADAVDSEVATIEYTLINTISRNESRYMKDGQCKGYGKYDWNYGTGDRKAVKNSQWNSTIKETLLHRGDTY